MFNVKENNRRLYLKRKAAGICGCGNSSRSGKTQCGVCAKRGGENSTKRFKKMYAVEKQRRIYLGLCGRNYCKNQRIEGSVGGCCEECTIKRTAQSAGYKISTGVWRKLRDKLEAQNSICPLSGRKLAVGLNASLDHILPRSRGGSNDIDNLRWVDYQVNVCKRNLLDDEWAALCRDCLVVEGVGK